MSPSSALRDAMPAKATLAERVRARLRADGIDPTRGPEAGERLARAEVRRDNDAALARGATTLDDEDASVRSVLATVAGYGPLQPLLDDAEIEEVWIKAPDHELPISTSHLAASKVPLLSEIVRIRQPFEATNLVF